MNEAALFVNAKARRGDEWFDHARAALALRGIKLQRSELIKKPDAMRRAVREEIAKETPLIILGGGDGTFNSVCKYFVGSESVLGILPLGTGNAFARDLGIRTDVDSACDVISAGNVSAVDMGYVEDRYFLNVATIGLTTLIARNLEPSLKRVLGPAAYAVSLARAMMAVKPFRVTLEMGDEKCEFVSQQVVIGNGRFHAGPFLLAPDASLASGQLLIYALESDRKVDLFKLALAVQLGRQVDLANVRVWRTSGGRLSTSPQRTVTLDGEPTMETPVKFGIKPGALRVLAAASLPGSS